MHVFGTVPNSCIIAHLCYTGMELTKEEFISSLKERLASTDIDLVKQDVMRFLRTDPHSLDIWSNDYFLQLADMIVYK